MLRNNGDVNLSALKFLVFENDRDVERKVLLLPDGS